MAQCPTGYIDAVSLAWVDEYYRVKSSKEATGSPYFASLAEADPITVSVFELLERENAMIDAEVRQGLSR